MGGLGAQQYLSRLAATFDDNGRNALGHVPEVVSPWRDLPWLDPMKPWADSSSAPASTTAEKKPDASAQPFHAPLLPYWVTHPLGPGMMERFNPNFAGLQPFGNLGQKPRAKSAWEKSESTLEYSLTPGGSQRTTSDDKPATEHEFAFKNTWPHHAEGKKGGELFATGSITAASDAIGVTAGGGAAYSLPLGKGVGLSGEFDLSATNKWLKAKPGEKPVDVLGGEAGLGLNLEYSPEKLERLKLAFGPYLKAGYTDKGPELSGGLKLGASWSLGNLFGKKQKPKVEP